jgi:hypothetical protein
MVAIEESDDVARTVLADTIPKLRGIAGRLVDLAERREKWPRQYETPRITLAAPRNA